jgi:cell division protein FtsI (penicillin-binding protein 3)
MEKFPGKTRLKPFNKTEITKRQPQKNKPLQESSIVIDKKQESVTSSKSRLLIVWGVLVAAGLGLGINLYQLQIVRGPSLTERARNQQMVNLRPFLPRRQVVDRTNNVLAIDRPVYTVYAHPKQFKTSSRDVAAKLATILSKDAEELNEKFENKRSGILLASALSEELADQIFRLRLDGLELIQKYSRYYPQQDLLSNVVGYVDLDRRGQAGLEISQEKYLERSVQTVRLSRAGNGSLMPDHAPEGFMRFDDLRLQLTLDSSLQRAARTALKKQMDRFGSKRGAVVVMDATDGSLLALVSLPTYNPNEYSKANVSLFRNWAAADLYEPGSTFKPLNVAVALETGVIKSDEVFNDPGFINVGDRTIRNAENKRFGRINVAQVLQNSSNIGMVRIIQRMRPSSYYGWLERMGIGQKSDTDLPFEVASQLRSQEDFIAAPIEAATASFGQGFSVTPLQLVQMVGALANGGKLVTPHVVKGLMDTKGQIHYTPNQTTPRQIFSPTTTQRVVEMMETVVNRGTGKAAQIPGYRIAGKTGTSQKAARNGGYIAGARITSFVGILPVEAPRYVVLAIVDEPKGENAYGSKVAAPIAKKVMEALISIEKLPPARLNPQGGE